MLQPVANVDAIASGPLPSDTQLASRVRLGDMGSMDELVRRHWIGLVDYCSRFADDRDAAKDLAQDALLALWERTVDWKETGTIRAFLYGVARNFARNRGRRWREVRVLALVDRSSDATRQVKTPAEQLEAGELRRAIQVAVAALPPRRQEIFILARVHGMTHAEIANTLELSSQTVANQMATALAELKRRLAHLL